MSAIDRPAADDAALRRQKALELAIEWAAARNGEFAVHPDYPDVVEAARTFDAWLRGDR